MHKACLGIRLRPQSDTTEQCCIIIIVVLLYSQLNNKPRVVVTDFRLHHNTAEDSLSGVIRRLLCNPHTFSPGIIIMKSSKVQTLSSI